MHHARRIAGIVLIVASGLQVGLASQSAAAQSADPTNTMVIVFKDGHRQTFNLADVAQVEFPGGAPNASATGMLPTRRQFIGRWEVGEGNGENFTITLREDGTASRSLGHDSGTWKYSNGAAEITWSDGWQDAIRKVGGWYKKYAYAEGKTFADSPDNVANARNLTRNASGVD